MTQKPSDLIRDSEAWAVRQAQALSGVMLLDPRNAHIPSWSMTVNALAVLLAGAYLCPAFRQIAERVRQEHRDDAHAGQPSDQCEECGYYEAAYYNAISGKQLADTFLEPKSKEAPRVR